MLLIQAPASASVAAPAPEATVRHIITSPAWLTKPTSKDLLSVYPAAASQAGVPGEALLACRVGRDGSLRDCAVKRESPAGYGFGQAAVALAPQFRMRPKTVDGQAVDDGAVTVPIHFAAADAPPLGVATTVPMLARGAFERAPTPQQVRAAYPPAALARGEAGVGTIRCRVDGIGVLRDCGFGRRPDPHGFNAAALDLAGRFKAASTIDGQSTTGALVQVSVAFSPREDAPPLDARPVWIARPTPEEAHAAFPAAAAAQGLTHLAVTEACTVGVSGGLEGCEPVKEEPAGVGGDAAAKRLIARFRMSVWSTAGRPTGGARINLPVVWDLPAAKPAG